MSTLFHNQPLQRLSPRPQYLSLILAAIQQAIAYRGHTLLSIISKGIWVIATYYLWRAVFADTSQIVGYDWDRMRTYIVLAYTVNSLHSFSSTARMIAIIRTGEVAQDLLRPIDYLALRLTEAVGAAIIEGIVSTAMTILLGIFVIGIQPPVSPAGALLFLTSVFLGFLTKFLICFLVSLVCFWTVSGVGLVWAQTAVVDLFSGALVPLALFPDWLQTVVGWMPFQCIIHKPLTIYLGEADSIRAVLVQIVWVVLLWLLARALWGSAIRALDIQGG